MTASSMYLPRKWRAVPLVVAGAGASRSPAYSPPSQYLLTKPQTSDQSFRRWIFLTDSHIRPILREYGAREARGSR